jgi:MFS family permease
MRIFWAGVVGNIADHYDAALYGFMAPVVAPLFFPSSNPIISLILTYGVLANSVVTRVLGTLVFSRLVDRLGEKRSLTMSLVGSCICTVSMGLLPTYESVGIAAPILLVSLRSFQSFFSAGERIIAPFWLLKTHAATRPGLINSFFQSSTVMGILLASAAATAVSVSPEPTQLWRWAFLLGSATAIVGLYIRFGLPKDPHGDIATTRPYIAATRPLKGLLHKIRDNRLALLRVCIASGFTYMTYSVPFVFLNSFVPLITSISYSEMMFLNTAFLVLDMTLLPLFGVVADRIGHARVMSLAAAGLAFSILPSFALLPGANIWFVSTLRICIVLLGLAFLAPLHAWFYRQFHYDKYLLSGLGYALGADALGKTAPAICMALWHATDSVLAPAAYVVALSALTAAACFEPISQAQPNTFLKNKRLPLNSHERSNVRHNRST